MLSREPSSENKGPAILRVELDSRICSACESCIILCPEVFNIDDGQVALNDDAASYYESKSKEILDAERDCPTTAIRVLTDPPRPPRAKVPPSERVVFPPNATLAEKLRYARDLAEGKTPWMVRKPWWKFW
jgi:ferredoxin